MTVHFLLSMEDSATRDSVEVRLFSDKAEAKIAMETAYFDTIKRLNFDTTTHSERHYCGCGEFFAVITEGEDNYSWSIGKQEVMRPKKPLAS